MAGHTPGVDQLRTLLVGLDGACLSVLEGIPDGDLPALRGLIDRGTGGPLAAQFPPWTASAWPSIYTGVNPGRHGVFDFLAFDGYDWDVVDRSRVREHAVWELLDRHDRRSVVVNVPVTAPPVPFDGALVPGYVAPDPPTCHPEGILEWLGEQVGDYRVYPDPETDERDARVEEYRELVALRGAAFRALVERFRPDFGFLQFQSTDTVFHELPGDEAAVETVYRAVDEQLDRTLAACQPDTVLVVSDHGIGRYDGYGFRANEFLREHGYLETTRGGEGMPSWAAVARDRLLADAADDPGRPGVETLLARAATLAAKAGLTSQRIERLLEPLGLAEFVAEHAPTAAVRAGTERVDFPASRAYVRSRLELGVRINLEGRDPQGQVSQEDYEELRAELIELLSGVHTPDDEPVFEEVLPREAVFEGPYLDNGPDLVTVPTGFDHLTTAALLGERFGPPTEPYEHKPAGLVIAAGEAVDAEASPDGASALDVAPTVLSTLGVPASDRMDGELLGVVDTDPPERREYPAFDGVSGTEHDGTVKQRLSELGYIE